MHYHCNGKDKKKKKKKNRRKVNYRNEESFYSISKLYIGLVKQGLKYILVSQSSGRQSRRVSIVVQRKI